MGYQKHKTDGGVLKLLQPVFHQVQSVRGGPRGWLPNRHRIDEFNPVAADSYANRAGVRGGHRDGVHPGGCLDLKTRNQLQHCRAELFPAKIGLKTGEHQKLLPNLIPCQIQGKHGWLIVGHMVGVKKDGGAAGAVVEQDICVERGNELVVNRGGEVFAQLGDNPAGIGKAGKPGH